MLKAIFGYMREKTSPRVLEKTPVLFTTAILRGKMDYVENGHTTVAKHHSAV